jgi:hypothetical protein
VDVKTLSRITLYICAVALVGLAVFQGTDPPHAQALGIGVATKILTALVVVVVAHLMQPPEA